MEWMLLSKNIFYRHFLSLFTVHGVLSSTQYSVHVMYCRGIVFYKIKMTVWVAPRQSEL